MFLKKIFVSVRLLPQPVTKTFILQDYLVGKILIIFVSVRLLPQPVTKTFILQDYLVGKILIIGRRKPNFNKLIRDE